MTQNRFFTMEDLDRYEAAQRDKAPTSNGHVRAPPKTEPAHFYTKTPNWVFDMPERKKLDASSAVVLFEICRLTVGMHKERTAIGLDRLATRCNLAKSTCNLAIHRLEEAGLVRRVRNTTTGGRQVASSIEWCGEPE